MAERLDDVLAELMASQEEAPVETPEEAQPTEPAPAEGGHEAPVEETSGEPMAEEVTPAAKSSENPVGQAKGEVPTPPAPYPRMEAVLRSAEAAESLRNENAQLREAMARMQQMTAQTQQAAQEANRANEEAVVAAVLKPPVLDFNSVQYLGEDERQLAMERYGSAMADYARQSIMQELQPMVDHFKRQTKEAEDTAVRNKLGGQGGWGRTLLHSGQAQRLKEFHLARTLLE